MTPMLAGIVVGFLLLDQRDDQTLTALQVTPLTLSGYFAYRIAVPTVVEFFRNAGGVSLTGLVALGPFALVSAGLSSCLLAPLYALFLGTFANEQGPGVCADESLGILLVPPLVAYFVHPPWQVLFGVDPLYWPVKVFWLVEAEAVNAWVYLAIAIIVQIFVLRLLLQRMNHRVTP